MNPADRFPEDEGTRTAEDGADRDPEDGADRDAEDDADRDPKDDADRNAEELGSGDADFVPVATVHGPFQEAQISSFLQSRGIPVRIRGEAIRRIHGITMDGIGAATVAVPSRFAEMARELIAQAERGELRIEDDADVGDGGAD